MYDEKELIRECICGNRLAEKQLYEQYSARFFGICLRYAESREEAEDMLVGGFTMIFKRLSDFRADGSFEGWMRRIIVNHAIDSVRKRHAPEPLPIEGLQMTETATAEHILQRIDARHVMAAIRRLPPVLRTVFNLYAIEGYAHKEIAQRLGIKESSARAYLSTAKTILQETLAEFAS